MLYQMIAWVSWLTNAPIDENQLIFNPKYSLHGPCLGIIITCIELISDQYDTIAINATNVWGLLSDVGSWDAAPDSTEELRFTFGFGVGGGFQVMYGFMESVYAIKTLIPFKKLLKKGKRILKLIEFSFCID